VNKELSVF